MKSNFAKGFKHLKGKEVQIDYSQWKANIEDAWTDYAPVGITVGIDPDIGITIVDSENPDHYVFCLNKDNATRYNYEETFKYMVSRIEAGQIDPYEVQKVYLTSPISEFVPGTGSECAFK